MIKWLRNAFRQPPRELVLAKRAVELSMGYTDYESKGLKIRLDGTINLTGYKPRFPEGDLGNCVDHALAYQRRLGGRGVVVGEKRKGMQDHAYLWVDGWRLDVLLRSVVWQGDKI